MDFIVMQPDKIYKKRNVLLRAFSIVFINFMLLPLLCADFFLSIYHSVYFRINGMPLVPRKKYIVLDRGRLKKLNWAQRWGCLYCDHANGFAAWAKAIINTTEVYSCAIKHKSPATVEEHQHDYFPYEKFQ